MIKFYRLMKWKYLVYKFDKAVARVVMGEGNWQQGVQDQLVYGARIEALSGRMLKAAGIEK